MQQMSSTCFGDILGFGTTNEIYDSFADSFISNLKAILVSLSGKESRSMKRLSYVAEVVRHILKDILTGDLEVRASLPRRRVLNETTALVLAAATNSRESGTIKLIR